MTNDEPVPIWDEGVPYCVKYNSRGDCPHYDGKRCGLLGHRPHEICEPAVKEMSAQLQSNGSEEADTPSETEMRTQMFNTMKMLEQAAHVVIGESQSDTLRTAFLDWMNQHTNASGVPEGAPKQPVRLPAVPVDYSNCRVVCKRCGGVVVFKEGALDRNDSFHNCICSDIDLDNLGAPPDVLAALKRAAAEKAKQQDGPAVFDGDVVVRGDLRVEGCTTTVESDIEMLKLREADVADIQQQLKAHREAIAILAKFAAFGGASFGLPDPQREVARKVGVISCDCVGTGWVARDEQCSECGGRGYKQA